MTCYIVTDGVNAPREVSSEYTPVGHEVKHILDDTDGVIASSTSNYFDVQDNHPLPPTVVEWSQEKIDGFLAENQIVS